MTAPAFAVKDINEIRRDNARQLATQESSLAAFADRIDRSATQVSRFMGKNPTKGIGDKIARHIETTYGKERGWLDQDHSQQVDQPIPPQVNEPTQPYLLKKAVSSNADIEILRDVIEDIEEVIREEREELTSTQKAHAIAASLAARLKHPDATIAKRAITISAIRAVT